MKASIVRGKQRWKQSWSCLPNHAEKMSWRKVFILTYPHNPPSSLYMYAALASIIKSTCQSFQKVKEGIDWEKTQDGSNEERGECLIKR